MNPAMDRRQFLRQSATWGGCCGVALMAGATSAALGAEAPPADAAEPAATPCARRVEQGQKVIKRLMDQMDRKLDRPTREEIMEACGRLCHDQSHPVPPPPTPEATARFLDGMRRYLGDGGVEQVGPDTIVHFKYTQNPKGLKTADGYCLCPILEDAPKDVSPTYCQCSVGYVKAIFEQGVGRAVEVHLDESVLRGGKNCRFTVRFRTA